MELNLTTLILVLLGVILLLLFLIVRNKKDKKDLMKSMNAESDMEIQKKDKDRVEDTEV